MPHIEYEAVIFDLLTALLDSWSFWNSVAGSEKAGIAWRMRYLERTYQTGAYRPYTRIIEEAAADVGLSPRQPAELIERWAELEPWPEAPNVVSTLVARKPIAIATNASTTLGNLAAESLGVAGLTVVTAEEAGYYKPDPRPYRMALERIGCVPKSALFVAGSPVDVLGASEVGMPVYWHNRRNLKPPQFAVPPICVADSLLPLLQLV